MKKNIEFIVSDIVEHWEKGIGKIIAIENEGLCILFRKEGEVILPTNQCGYLKKVEPDGFLSQFYENDNKILEMISEASQDIIKLLIIDNGGKGIERSRIRQLLGKSPDFITGWRKDLCFVSDKEWSQWWSKVSKKISKDPTFDTTTKNVIALNKTDTDPIIIKFNKEQKTSRKLAISEQIIDKYNVSFGVGIIEEINDLVFEYLRDTDIALAALAIVAYVKLKQKDMLIVSPTDDDEDIILVRTIISGDLSAKNSKTLYEYLISKLQQDIFYHFIIYLYGGAEIKKRVLSNIRSLSFAENQLALNDATFSISRDRIALLEWLSSIKSDGLQHGRHGLKELDDMCLTSSKTLKIKGLITNIYLAILFSDSVPTTLKDTIARHVSENKNNATVFGYLNRLDKIINPSIEYITLFINSISHNQAVEILYTTIFTNEIAVKNPALYEAILLKIDSGEILQGVIDIDRKKLFSKAYQSILPDSSQETSSLKIKIATLLETYSIADQEATYSNEELVGLITKKSTFIGERRNAIELLDARLKSNLLMSSGKILAEQTESDDWQLLKTIIEKIGDEKYSIMIIGELIKNVLQDRIRKEEFMQFILQVDCISQIVETLINMSNSITYEQKHNLENILNNENIVRAFAKRVLTEVVANSDLKSQVIDKMRPYYSEATMAAIDEASFMIMNIKTMYEERQNVLNEAHFEELTKLENIFEDRVADTISKTKQRYEEHAMKLKGTIGLLAELQAKLNDIVLEKINNKWISECSNVISMAEEDIALILKKMGIE